MYIFGSFSLYSYYYKKIVYMKRLIFTFCVVLAAIGSANAQFGALSGAMNTDIVITKTKLESGDVSSIKGKTVKVVLDFEGMLVSRYKVGFGKKIAEADYIKDKTEAINKKDPGKGDEWAKKWEEDKLKKYPTAFVIKYNEMGAKYNSVASTETGDITLVIHAVYCEPGYFIGIDKAPAKLNFILEFKDAAGNSIAKLNMTNCPGQAFGFGDVDTGARIAEAYEKCAKELMQFMEKKWK